MEVPEDEMERIQPKGQGTLTLRAAMAQNNP